MERHWYEKGDTITYDKQYAMALFLTRRYWPDGGRSPWHVYSTNKYPQYNLCALVRVIHEEFTKEFGTAFGFLDIHGGDLYYWGNEPNESWRPPSNLTMNKPYVKRNEDGWIVVTNPKKFLADIIAFKKRMREQVLPNYHYFHWGGGYIGNKRGFWERELRRVDMFLIASDKERQYQ